MKKISTVFYQKPRLPYPFITTELYVCRDCGTEFDECQMGSHRGFIGEYQGQDVYDSYGVCPKCGSTYYATYEEMEEERVSEARDAMRANRVRGKVYRVIA